MAKYTPEQHTKAYELYMTSKLTLPQIATAAGVNKNTIIQWIDQEDWASKKKAIVKTGMSAIDNEFSSFLQEKRLEVAKRHLDQASELSDRIHRLFKKREDGTMPYLNPGDALKLAQALKNATEIEAKAVGLDRPLPNENLGTKHSGPLILVGLQAKPVEANQNMVVEVDAEDVEFTETAPSISKPPPF